MRTEAEFAFDPPELLFETAWFFADYEPSHDGERFLIRRPVNSGVTDAGSPRIDLVLDSFAEVRERMGLDGS